MSDLPKWAQGEGDETATGNLEDKLVDESGESKPAPAPAPESDAEDARPAPQESPLASRALCFFRCLSVLTVILALVVIGTNCYIIYKRYDEIKARGILLRIYGILFCVFIVFAEMEWNRFTKFFGFLKYWPARGLFYVFVALITWDQSGSTDSSSYGTYEDVVAFLMMAVGGLYFLLGLACMRTVKEAEAARMAEADA